LWSPIPPAGYLREPPSSRSSAAWAVQLSFYGSAFVLGTSDFPLTEIPLAEMIGKAEAGVYQAKPARVFGFDDIVEAHRLMESGLAGGKMTVSVV
jgi:NADPH2:quinone reductase